MTVSWVLFALGFLLLATAAIFYVAVDYYSRYKDVKKSYIMAGVAIVATIFGAGCLFADLIIAI